jgi:hypothetical protein
MVFYACCAGCVLKSTTDIHTQGWWKGVITHKQNNTGNVKNSYYE